MARTLVIASCLLAAAGCSSQPATDTSSQYPDDQNPDTPLSPGKADYVAMPFQTYRSTTTAVGRFSLLVVTDNGIFHREKVTSCSSPPCAPKVEEGLPITSRSGSTSYIRFEDFDGNLIDRYAWKWSEADGTLKLRKVGNVSWQTMTVSPDAWCKTLDDCDAQQLDAPCAGTWSCQSQICKRTCDYTACGTAGGTCGAASACATGVVGDAKEYPCKNSQACCLPADAGVSFDPVAADNVAQAFAAASTEASKVFSSPSLSFVTVQGTPQKIGTSYASTVFDWGYVFVASGANNAHTVVSVKAPGWSASHSSGLPSGAYLPQDLFSSSIKLDFAQILGKATAAGVSLSSCPFTATGSDRGFVDVQGSFGPGGVVWFWEIACQGASGLYRFDASTGTALN